MTAQGTDILIGQKSIALLIEERQLAHHGMPAVFVFEHMVMLDFFRNQAGLVVAIGAEGSAIDLDESGDVGVDRLDEI